MKNGWWTTLMLLVMLGCGGSGLDRPVEFAAEPASEAPPEPFPGEPSSGDQHPLTLNPATWLERPSEPSGFELLTDPGELPFFRLATGEGTARLPLDHTHVSATLHGLIAEVELTQTYENPHSEPIEAVYVFPLPENSAVNFMEMRIGRRKIVAKIDERERARRTYQAAKRAGFTAALLEQERPNVFTQSVANIAPGESIDVTLRYVQDLSYDRGQYEFVFPMVVGPRFMPGAARGESQGSGTHPDTTAVPDASRISPPYTGKGERSGHDISIEVHADAGEPIQNFRAITHEVAARKAADGSLHLTLAEARSIPNRDFVLRYATVTHRPQAALYVSESSEREGFFSLVLEPPALDVESLVGRREIVFVVDVSGSMSGTPLAMCRSAMRTALERLRPFDTFNIVTFAGHTSQAFPQPRPANRHNVAEALRIVGELSAGGGTFMANAIDAALAPPVEPGRHRYVFFMTDGYIGNEAEIIDKSQRFVENLERQGARAKVFGFGVGSSPNRHLVSGLSRAGKGISLYATNREDPHRAVNQFFHYIDRAVLTDVRIDWNGLQARQVYPSEIPDLFASHPLILHGRFQGDPGRPVQVLARAGDTQLTIPVRVERAVTRGEPSRALGALWARAKVDGLEEALLDGSVPNAEAQITELGLGFNLVTRFTSFVAVDSSRRVGSGDPRQVVQPAEQPEGVDLEMAGGHTRISESAAVVQKRAVNREQKTASPQAPMSTPGGPPAPTSGAGTADPSAAPEAEASEGYGYSYEDDPMSAGGFEEGAESADGMEPPSSADEAGSTDLANEDSDQDYQVASKRGCGCRVAGDPGSGLALGLVLGLTALAAWSRRRQRTRATLRGPRGPHQHQPSPEEGRGRPRLRGARSHGV